MINTPFNSWPQYSDEEIEAVSNILKTGRVNYWTGDDCKLFETEFADFCNAEYAIAVSNGTIALELALKALNLSSGDEVIVSPRTFVASISAIISTGAKPVFADVDLNSQNITLDSIQQPFTSKKTTKHTQHIAGWPCDMDPIMDWASHNKLWVIEDCAQAHGALYKGRPVGSLGHIAAWSFCQDKIMSTGGEGGMITTNDEDLYKLVWSLKDHGKSFDKYNGKDNRDRWVHQIVGTNGRLTNMQAAIGRIQLKKLGDWHKIRKKNASAILHGLENCEGLRLPSIPDFIEHAWYKLYVFVEEAKLKSEWNVNKIIKAINELGVPCYEGICPEVYREEAVHFLVEPNFSLMNARALGQTSLMLLVHPTLRLPEIQKTIEVVHRIMKQARK